MERTGLSGAGDESVEFGRIARRIRQGGTVVAIAERRARTRVALVLCIGLAAQPWPP
jgi:hypothetical protein